MKLPPHDLSPDAGRPAIGQPIEVVLGAALFSTMAQIVGRDNAEELKLHPDWAQGLANTIEILRQTGYLNDKRN